MNKKGFAVSVILYSIVFLIITTLFMLLGLVRTRFMVNDKLRDSVIEEVNEDMNVGIVFHSSERCVINANTNDYTENLILTISVNNGSSYSWDNEIYGTDNTTVVNRSGVYVGYFKDKAGGNGSCEREIISKTRYAYRTCKHADINYGAWYAEEEYVTTCPGGLKSKAQAESNNDDQYQTCTSVNVSFCPSGSSTCNRLMKYKRNPVGCSWTNEEWIISDTFQGSSAIIESRSATVYKVK